MKAPLKIILIMSLLPIASVSLLLTSTKYANGSTKAQFMLLPEHTPIDDEPEDAPGTFYVNDLNDVTETAEAYQIQNNEEIQQALIQASTSSQALEVKLKYAAETDFSGNYMLKVQKTSTQTSQERQAANAVEAIQPPLPDALISFAQDSQEADRNITDIIIHDQRITIHYVQSVQLFRLVPIHLTETITLRQQTSINIFTVSVTFPWWHIFTSKIIEQDELNAILQKETIESTSVIDAVHKIVVLLQKYHTP